MTETTEILKERGQRYGRFDGHANVTQRLKGVIAGELHIRRKELANYQQEALDMICHKIGRIINGDANYEDSWRDIAGYAQLVADRLLEPANATPVCGDTAVESVKQTQGKTLKYSAPELRILPHLPDGWDYHFSGSGKAAINAVREQIKEERLKSSAPEPVLPAGWTRPSKAYPQVAEDPSTGWQYIYGDGGWKRLIKPLHEMSVEELNGFGKPYHPYPFVYSEQPSDGVKDPQQENLAPPESVSDAAEDSLAKAVRMMGSGWKLVESANSIIAKDDSGLAHIWYNGKWFLAPQLGYIY